MSLPKFYLGDAELDVAAGLQIGDFFKIEFIGTILEALIRATFIFGALAILLYLAWSAFGWITSGGDKNQLAAARQRMTDAFMGFTLIAAAWAIFMLIVYVFGLPINIRNFGVPRPTQPPVVATPTPSDCGCSLSLTAGASDVVIGESTTISSNASCYGGASIGEVGFSEVNGLVSFSPRITNTPPFQTQATCNSQGTATIQGRATVNNCTVLNTSSSVNVNCIPPVPGTCNSGMTSCSCDCPAGYVPDPNGCADENPITCGGTGCLCIPEPEACTPLQLSPADGATFLPGSVTATWEGCPEVDWYAINIFKTGNGASEGSTMVNSTSYVFENLQADSNVSWSIRNCSGPTISTCYGPTSGDRTFHIRTPGAWMCDAGDTLTSLPPCSISITGRRRYDIRDLEGSDIHKAFFHGRATTLADRAYFLLGRRDSADGCIDHFGENDSFASVTVELDSTSFSYLDASSQVSGIATSSPGSYLVFVPIQNSEFGSDENLHLCMPPLVCSADTIDITGATGERGGGGDMGQSFTTTSSANLSRVELCINPGIQWVFHLRRGEDVNGPLIATSERAIDTGTPCGAGVEHIMQFNFPTTPQLYNNRQYTLIRENVGVIGYVWAYNNTDPYPGGRAYHNGSWNNSIDQRMTIYLTCTCTSDSDCSDFCSNDQDIDDDGYFARYTSGIGSCRSGVADCRDNNRDVHPNQFNYFETAIPGTSNDFDYDCADADGDGDVNDKYPRFNCISTMPNMCLQEPLPPDIAAQSGWETSIPNCGARLFGSGSWITCAAINRDNCSGQAWSYTSCNSSCPYNVGDNVCGWDQDEPCLSWTRYSKPAFPGHTDPWVNMPCK